MRLSDFTDYSLRVLMYSALTFPEPTTIDQVSQAFRISRHHLVKVVHHLGKLGYLKTRRGIGGGFTLAKVPEEIQIGRLVRRTETTLTLVECFDPETNQCRLTGTCRLKGVLAEAQGAFFETLDKYSLADLIR